MADNSLISLLFFKKGNPLSFIVEADALKLLVYLADL